MTTPARAKARPAAALRTPLIAALVTVVSACDRSPAPTLRFDTLGGDTWSGVKVVTGTITPSSACDEVRIDAPSGAHLAARDGGAFTASVSLVPGDNSLRALCLEAGRVVTRSPLQIWRSRLEARPHAVAVARLGEDSVVISAAGSTPSEIDAAPLVTFAWYAGRENPAALIDVADGDALPTTATAAASRQRLEPTLALALPTTPGTYTLTLRVADERGRSDTGSVVFRVTAEGVTVPDPERDSPDWLRGAVVYGVIPYFFGDGAFADVIARLDAIAALGITALWLSPVTDAAPGDFGYAVVDHFGVREELGGDADLAWLVAEAHARGLRVLLDFVPNHTSSAHPYFQSAKEHGRRSPYWAFYARDDAGEPLHYFDWEDLPNLSYDNPEVRRMMTAAFTRFVRDFDVDGFRVDVAWGVHERAPEFFHELRRELKRIKPQALLLGEMSARAVASPDPRALTLATGFDAAYDWTTVPGDWAWRGAFAEPALAGAALATAVGGPSGAAFVFRFLNNNDTGERFVTRFGPDVTRTATAMLLTLPGLPCIYTGDEVGAAYEPYDEGPALTWEDPYALTPYFKKLIALRARVEALHEGSLQLLSPAAKESAALLAYLRQGAGPDDDVLVLLNYGGEEAVMTLARSSLGDLAEASVLFDELSGATVALAEGADVALLVPGNAAMVLRWAR